MGEDLLAGDRLTDSRHMWLLDDVRIVIARSPIWWRLFSFVFVLRSILSRLRGISNGLNFRFRPQTSILCFFVRGCHGPSWYVSKLT